IEMSGLPVAVGMGRQAAADKPLFPRVPCSGTPCRQQRCITNVDSHMRLPGILQRPVDAGLQLDTLQPLAGVGRCADFQMVGVTAQRRIELAQVQLAWSADRTEYNVGAGVDQGNAVEYFADTRQS